jgi:hypothetical protein
MGEALENANGLPVVYTALGKLIKDNPKQFKELQKTFRNAKNDSKKILF